MDLTNLTLDELLEQIKSGSFTPTVSKPLIEPTAEETKPQELPIKEESEKFLIEELPIQQEEEPNEAEESVLVYEPQPQAEADESEEAEGLFVEEFFVAEEAENAAYSPAPVFEPEDSEQEDIPTLFTIPEEAAEEAEIEQPVFYAPPTAPEPIEIIEDGEPEEPAPMFTAAVYTPPTAQPAPLEIVDTDEAEEQPPVYTPPVPQEKAAEPETQSFKIFGNINIDADVNSFFPEITEEEAPTDTADSKTRKIGDLPEKTAIFERPGIITGQKMFEKTGDLRAIPAILSADDMLKSGSAAEEKTFVRTGNIPIVAQEKSQTLQHDDGQMILPGFATPDEPEVHVEESKVEDELRKNRSKKVDSFKLEGVEEEAPHLDEETYEEISDQLKEKPKRFSATKTRTRLNKQDIEYRKSSDKAKVGSFIARKKLAALIGMAVSAVCALVLLITTGIPAVAQLINQGAADYSITALLSLVFLLPAFCAALPSCSSGISCFTSGSGKPNTQTPVIFSAIAALIQAVLLLIFDDAAAIPSFASAAAFVLCACCAGKWIAFTRIQHNFNFLASSGKDGLYTVRTVDNMSDANKIGKNVVMGEADIRYSGKTGFASNFLAYSMASDATDDLCAKLVPIVCAASAVIGIIAGIATKNAVCGISLFTGAMCIGAPASAIIAANLPLLQANKNAAENGGIITSYAGAFEYESTNALALDAADLFPGHCCNIHGMKTFYGVRLDDAILTAASMLISAGGPISSLFNEVVMGRKELLLNVEELVYEDRLGLSGWVRNRRVFVGNRKLLENHNIEIPMSVDEAKYRHDGRRVIYLADAGKIAAIFVVSYGTDERIAEYLRKIENSGINLLIRTTDSNITEEYVANSFGLPLNSVKIVSSNAGDVLKSYADSTAPKSEATLVHNGSAKGFLHCVSAAGSLCGAAGVITTQQTFCCAIGLLLLAVIVLFSGAFNVNALQICVCQLLWTALGILVPRINRN